MITALIVLMLFANVGLAIGQTVNMYNRVELKVVPGQQIRLNLKAAAANTGIKISCGSTQVTLTVGTSWSGFSNYYANDNIMKVYGDLESLDCSDNGNKITGVEVYRNGGTTSYLQAIYCKNNTAIEAYEGNSRPSILDFSGCTALKSVKQINFLSSITLTGCTALETLWCDYSRLTSLNLNGLRSLKNLFIGGAYNLTSLNLTGCTALENFVCQRSAVLTSLNLSGLTNLKDVTADQCSLTSLNVSGCTNLKELDCSNNNLTSLSLSGCTNLEGLVCYNNNITSLDLSGRTKLIGINCSDNNLTSLNISGCTQLVNLSCQENNLTSLDVSGLSALEFISCYGNNLSTQVFDDMFCAIPLRTVADDAEIHPLRDSSDPEFSSTVKYTNKQNAIRKNWKVVYPSGGGNIPATTGSTACVNTSRSVQLSVVRGQQISLRFAADAANTDIKVVSGSTERVLTIGTSWTSSSNYTASDTIMTIYGDFTKLDCSNNSNKITRVDAYSHGKLKELLCQENTALSYIQCTLNQLTNLKVNGCAALRTLYSSYNNLISLDVTTNTALESLTCSNNNITSLDVSKNVSLERLYCHQNKPTSLDVSKNTLLTLLQCYKNQLTSLRLGNNALLKKLDCSNNKLGALDISKCSAITTLDIYNNSFSTVALDDIYCLLPTRTVADNARITPAYDSSSANNPIVMATNRQNAVSKNWRLTYYSGAHITATTGTFVCPDIDIDHYIELDVAPGRSYNFQLKTTAAGTPIKVVSGSTIVFTQGITSSFGTEAFYAGDSKMRIYGNISSFDCQSNPDIVSMDFSNSQGLLELYCMDNQLTTLDLTGLTTLRKLNCSGNNLTSLDLRGFNTIENLYCDDNQLTYLNIGGLTNLKSFSLYGNNFTSEDLDEIYCELPTRDAADKGTIYPLYSSSSDQSVVLATNKQNAINKNWLVRYYSNSANIPATTGTYTCTDVVNMNNMVELDVVAGSTITLDLAFRDPYVIVPNVYVRVMSGSTDVTVLARNLENSMSLGGTDFLAGGSKMQIYGDITMIDCSDNGSNITRVSAANHTKLTSLQCKNNAITSIDVKGCKSLTSVICYGNNLSTSALDRVFCDLPLVEPTILVPTPNARIYPILSSSSSNYAAVMATNAQNAIDKNWRVMYYNNGGTPRNPVRTDIPATTGSYACPDMDKWIDLKVAYGSNVTLDIAGGSPSTGIRVVSGSTDSTFVVSNNLSTTVYMTFYAGSTDVRIYGDVRYLDCDNNGIVELKTSNNTGLMFLMCDNNNMRELNLRNNIYLQSLSCKNNSRLEVIWGSENLTSLQTISCQNSKLFFLDLQGLRNLDYVNCSNNNMSYLYVNGCTSLSTLQCQNNNLKSLDVSGLTSLKMLSCENNRFTVQALNSLYCSLPYKALYSGGTLGHGTLVPSYSSANEDNDTIMASNTQNAIDKNWIVQYNGGINIPATTSTYSCPDVDASKWIELAVNQGYFINVSVKSTTNNPARVVCGTTDVMVYNTNEYPSGTHYAADTIMRIYGDISNINCSDNGVNLTAVDISNNTNLKTLNCYGNSIDSLDVSNNTALENLYCSENNLTTLDVSNNPALKWLTCDNNDITSINFNANTALEHLYCENNNLTSLDVTALTSLQYLTCSGNALTSLDISGLASLSNLDCSKNNLVTLKISGNPALRVLYCYDNKFSTQALDNIYCSLPFKDVTGGYSHLYGYIKPLYRNSSPNYATVMASSTQNAVSKNWKVLNYDEDEFSTSGGYVCGTVAPPTIVTLEATNVRYTTATLSGVVDPGLNTIAEKGFEWKLTSGGTYVDLVSTDADNTFRTNLIGLTDNTGYTYRAYVKVGSNKVYGAEKTFTTEVIPVPTSVTTLNATSIGQTSATLNGSVVVGTYEAVSERGFEWKLTSGGTYADVVYTGTDDTFSVNLTGLADNTGYTFRAYVKVGENKIYGEEKTFTTIATGIENATQAVAIYPNPASNEANISVDGLNSDAIATIYDMQGKVVGTYTIPAATGRAVVDVSAFANGTYIVRIVSQEINRVERMIIKR